MSGDVIVAPATPPGSSALALVRLSGVALAPVLAHILRPLSGVALQPNRQRRVEFFDTDGVFDDGTVVLGRAPHTYTGEATAELCCHGNSLVVQRLLDAACAAGARMAQAGEFTRRAVCNGKLDLLQAEAVDQISRASSAVGLRLARAGLDGELSATLNALRVPMVEIASELEAMLDHPDEALLLRSDEELGRGLSVLVARAECLAADARRGARLLQSPRVALVGGVNVGKSSLFNALIGRTRALVHHRPGTTRDVLEAPVLVEGRRITLMDTAGERVTSDPVEAAGLALARELVAEASLLLVVLRAAPRVLSAFEHELLARTADQRRVVVYNGVDQPHDPPPVGAVCTSALHHHGIAELGAAVVAALDVAREPPGLASLRQAGLLDKVAQHCAAAAAALPLAGPAVAAECVTEALSQLDTLTGADTREDVLDALFARFCIGK